MIYFLGSIDDTFGFFCQNKLVSKNHDQLLWMGELLQSWFSFHILENYFSFQQMILSWLEYTWNHYWKPLIHSVFSFCLLRNVHKPSMFLRQQILCLGWSLYTNHWLHRNCWWRWCQKTTLNYHPPREFSNPNMKTLWLIWCWNSTTVDPSLVCSNDFYILT